MGNNPDIQKNLKFSYGKVISMGLASVLLYFSFMMSIFTPYPIGLSSILYGRKKAAIIGVFASVICFYLTVYVLKNASLFWIFLSIVLSGLALAEVVVRGYNPIKGIIAIATAGAIMTALLLIGIVQTEQKSLRSLMIAELQEKSDVLENLRKGLKNSNEKDSLETEALLAQPEKLVDEALKSGPSFVLMSLLIFLWANMFLLLKSSVLVGKSKSTPFTGSDLAHFKVRESVIWPVIISGCLTLWGDQLGPWYSTVGITALKTLGVFYFFQGFGIYLAFLDFLNLRGFFRSLMVVITIMSAGQALAIIGLFDMFINFRKFLKRKNLGE